MSAKSSSIWIASAILTVSLTDHASAAPKKPRPIEPRTVVGTDNNVRVDAQIFDEELGAGSPLHFSYEIQNLRDTPISVAEVRCETSYDQESRTIMLQIGTEIPKPEAMQKLVTIAPGERKTFTGAARAALFFPRTNARLPYPQYVQVKLNFLNDAAKIAGKNPDALFDFWITSNEIVMTNAVPIRWKGQDSTLAEARSASSPGFGGGM